MLDVLYILCKTSHLVCVYIWLTFKSEAVLGIKRLIFSVILSKFEILNSFKVSQAIKILSSPTLDWFLTTMHRTRQESVIKMQMARINVWHINSFLWNITHFNSALKNMRGTGFNFTWGNWIFFCLVFFFSHLCSIQSESKPNKVRFV